MDDSSGRNDGDDVKASVVTHARESGLIVSSGAYLARPNEGIGTVDVYRFAERLQYDEIAEPAETNDVQPRPTVAPASEDYVVRCQHCATKWDEHDVYRTGDVLRCPSCDGVMRP